MVLESFFTIVGNRGVIFYCLSLALGFEDCDAVVDSDSNDKLDVTHRQVVLFTFFHSTSSEQLECYLPWACCSYVAYTTDTSRPLYYYWGLLPGSGHTVMLQLRTENKCSSHVWSYIYHVKLFYLFTQAQDEFSKQFLFELNEENQFYIYGKVPQYVSKHKVNWLITLTQNE